MFNVSYFQEDTPSPTDQKSFDTKLKTIRFFFRIINFFAREYRKRTPSSRLCLHYIYIYNTSLWVLFETSWLRRFLCGPYVQV